MKTEFETMHEDVKGANGSRLTSDLRLVARDTGQFLKDSWDGLKETGKTSCVRVKEGTVTSLKSTDQTLRTHPYESMGIALGFGIVAGWLIKRSY
ncbi:MAG: hypothetical protein M1608_08885 [Candidatus Omnitrophica bacterium]|nr:hypothetical protein [Candidatus Omnitrophota bacterium]